MVVYPKSSPTVAGHANTAKLSGLEHFYGSLPLKNQFFHFSDPFFSEKCSYLKKM